MSVEKEFERIKGDRPEPDYVWCDECLRWEWEGAGRKNRERIRMRGVARVWSALSRIVLRFGGRIDDRALLAKLRDNARRGLLIEKKPENVK